MKRIYRPSLFAFGFALAILGSWVNVALAGVVSCSAGTPGGALSTCTGMQSCVTSVTPSTLVRTLSGPAHIWQRWDVIAATSNVRLCEPDGWNSKQRAGVTLEASPAPSPSRYWACTPSVVDEKTVTLSCSLKDV